MKISKSKQELARIISENGGWREGSDTCSCDHDGYVSFLVGNPTRNGGSWLDNGDCEYIGGTIATKYEKIKNWHQTILSREEYFRLYPAPDADGWIEWKGWECPVEKGTLVDVIWRDGRERIGVKALQLGGAGHQFWVADGMVNDIIAYRLHNLEQAKPEFCESVMRSIPEPSDKPTIEQLAADYRNAKDCAERKQQEADDAKADAEVKLKALELAGNEIGIIVSPITEVELGDEVECIEVCGDLLKCKGMRGYLSFIDKDCKSTPYLVDFGGEEKIWCHEVKFIRRQ